MLHRIQQEKEKEIQGKAKRYAILLLLLLLMILFLPFISGELQTRQQFDKVITVQFDKEEFAELAAAKKSSTEPAPAKEEAAKEEEAQEEAVEEAVPEPEPVKEEPKPEPKQTPKKVTEKVPDPLPVPDKKPVLTSDSKEIDISSLLKDISKSAKVKEVTPEITEVIEEVSGDHISDITDYFKNLGKKKSKKKSSSSASGSGGSGTGTDAGEGDSGTSDTGDADTDGASDEGMEFEEDGLLTRKVIYRANLNDLIKESGKLVIDLCVNQDGRVVYSKIDKDRSTITDALLLKQAERTAEKYRYEKDYTAAKKQCGKLSFIIKIQN